MSEQKKMDAEREKFEAWMHTYDFPPALEGEIFNDERYPDADCFGQFVYDDLATQRCWSAWQARASLPVGVPDGWALVPVEPTRTMLHRAYDNNLMPWISRQSTGHDCAAGIWESMLAAAPTVKAEQVQCADPCGLAPHAQAFNAAPAEALIPSLPAAGLAVEEVEVVGTRYVAISESGRKISLVRLSRKRRPGWQEDDLMTVAQHKRIVAALSAQQSAPERVSVPVELLQDLHDLASDAVEHHRAAFAGYKLKRQANMDDVVGKARALLASHGRGEA